MSELSHQQTVELIDQIWRSSILADPVKVFAILDGSRDKQIERLLNAGELRYSCLYEGKLTYELASAAPYIVELEKNHQLTYEIIQNGWGKSWGVFARCPNSTTLPTIRRNCRKIAYIFDKNNKKYVFRYYDPRVLRIYLPTCEDKEAAKVFGPAVEFVAEKDVKTDNEIHYHQFVRSVQGVIDIQDYEATEYELVDYSLKPHQYNFLKIRDEQMRALMDEILEKDYQLIKRQFIKDFIDTPAEPIYINDKPVSLDAFLRGCLGHAINFKLEDQYSIYSFFKMCYRHGWKFWDQENNLWSKPILESSRKGDIKIEKLESQFSSRLMDQLWSA